MLTGKHGTDFRLRYARHKPHPVILGDIRDRKAPFYNHTSGRGTACPHSPSLALAARARSTGGMDVRRHARFYVALAAGLAVGAATPGFAVALRVLLAGDTFFVVYLALTAVFVARADASHLKARAARADEGLPLIVLVTVAAAALSAGAIFVLLRRAGAEGNVTGILAIASLPLGWMTLHTVMSFHYANLFYAPRRDAAGGSDAAAGGLDFPGTPAPGPWDFLYFSFVIGMTAQVSDVAVRTTAMRRAALGHGVVAFFYNAVILALAVNAAIAGAG